MKLNKRLLPLLGLLLILGYGCIPNKKIIYLQDLNKQADSIYAVQMNNYRLQKGDIVGIDVKVATENPVVSKIFSNVPNAQQQVIAQGGGDIYYMTGFTLDDSGYVNLPLVGKVNLLGHTVFSANEAVQTRFDEFLANVFVTVRFGGLRYSCLGEFNQPGKFVILQSRMTIFEAIASAGDLTVVAKRDKITILRQYPDGSRVHTVNLLDERIVSSPYYYIQPNDVIYAEPMPIRALGTGYTGFQSISLALSLLTSTLLIINLFK